MANQMQDYCDATRTELSNAIREFGAKSQAQIEGVEKRLADRFTRIENLLDSQIAVLQSTMTAFEVWSERMDRRHRR